MDKVDAQLATIIQDIKSPTLDALRAGVVADGVESLICVVIGFAILAAAFLVIRSSFRPGFRLFFMDKPAETDLLIGVRGVAAFISLLGFMLVVPNLFSPWTYINIFNPDAKIAQRIMYRR